MNEPFEDQPQDESDSKRWKKIARAIDHLLGPGHEAINESQAAEIRRLLEEVDDPTAGEDSYIGPYRILKVLGRGGQGIVYLAEDPKLKRKVALKTIEVPPEGASEASRRLRREAEFTAKLDHPAICPIYDIGESGNFLYLAMRMVEGATLASRILQARVPSSELSSEFVGFPSREAEDSPSALTLIETEGKREPTELPAVDSDAHVMRTQSATSTKIRAPFDGGIPSILKFVATTALALHRAHEIGLVHRDVKPGNIMVTDDGSPVILDFGLARLDDPAFSALTVTGQVLGTPAYMAPEQFQEDRHIDRRSDVYALGVTLFELLTLRRPFESATRERLFQAILNDAIPNPRDFNSEVSSDLRLVVETAMHKDPDRRYQDAELFAEDLKRVLEGRQILARKPSMVSKLWYWARQNRALSASLTALFLALTIGLTVSLSLLNHNRALLDLSKSTTERAVESERSALDAAHEAEEARREEMAARLGADAEKERAKRMVEALDIVSTERNARALRTEASSLYPLSPASLPAMEAWLERFQDLNEAGKTRALQFLEDNRRSGESENLAPTALRLRLKELEEHIARDERELAMPKFAEKRNAPRWLLHLKQLEIQRAELQLAVSEETVMRASEDKAEILASSAHGSIALIDALNSENGVVGQVRSMRDRTQRLTELMAREDVQSAWKDCISAVAKDEVYAGLALSPQFGLIPLGKNSTTGLQEFSDVLSASSSAEWPQRDPKTGQIELSAENGIIFVLLPGGTTHVGAQSQNSAKPNFDPNHKGQQAVFEVTLSPFFMAKHEVTQVQWQRLDGGRVPSFSAHLGKPLLPADSVSFIEAQNLAKKYLFEIPSGAQWEYACRSGRDKFWMLGLTRKELFGRANLVFGPQFGLMNVGSKSPNDFGLFDMIGNLREWTTDQNPNAKPRDGDGKTVDNGERETRQLRGGAYYEQPSDVDVSVPWMAEESDASMPHGLRVIRTIEN